MKLVTKKIAISGALSALLMIPASAAEVYSGELGKVDIYGSIRGYVGYGESGIGGTDGGYLIGIQNNSQFGVKYQNEKFKGNVEWGAVEPGVDFGGKGTGWRQYWGSYDSSFGTFLFGKTNTPMIDNGFTSDFINNDNGFMGFGGIATGSRKIQLQYNVAGLSLALVEDYIGAGRSIVDDNNASYRPTANQESPRIAVSYTVKGEGDKPLFKVAATYKYYNSDSIGGYTAQTNNNQTTMLINVPAGTNAWHMTAAFRPTFGNSYFSIQGHFGKNGHLYGEQSTRISTGAYQHSAIDSAVGFNAKRAGVTMEYGTKLSGDLGFVLGAGYQMTFNGEGLEHQAKTADGTHDTKLQGYSAFIQLPYKISQNFTFAPQVSFYQTIQTANKGAITTPLITNGKETGIIAAARIKWDF